jgi:rare lipoprotein A
MHQPPRTHIIIHRVASLLVLLYVVGCASPPPRLPEPQDGAPSHTPADLATLPDPTPRSEPKSARGNPPSYTVLGTTYRVMNSAHGYQATGLASWYGSKFHGRPTSSGEAFDMFKLSAAHRNLPLPTYVKVTNLQNGRAMIVRVNDRGPFHGDRLIDLSYAAAVKLGFAQQGTARVRVEAVDTAADFFLQAGAFRDLAAADSLKNALHTLTGQPAHVVRVSRDELFRVRVGPVKGRAEALRLQEIISSADYGQPLILEY